MARRTLRVSTTTAKTLPIMEVWVVYRLDPETNQIETYELTCIAGTFLTAYAALGHVDGKEPFDFTEDAWDRRLVRRFRDIP